MDLRLPAAAVLLATSGWVATSAEAARATPRPPAGLPNVLGGLTAVVAQAVWIQADRAILVRDEDRAMILLRTLVDLEPQVVGAARHAAQEIGWNMLQGREDPALRWSLVAEADRILSDCVARNPGAADALRNRGRYRAMRVATDAALDARFRTHVAPSGALAAAVDDLARAFAAAPDDSETSGLLARAALERGVELARDGDWTGAAGPLRLSAAAHDAVIRDAVEQLGDGAAGLDDVRRARGVVGELVAAAEAPDAERAALLAELRRKHPELGL